MYVQEHQVWFQALDLSDGFKSIFGFANYLDTFFVLQQPTQAHSSVGFVVNEQ
jgi:hypothetical protein